MGKLMMRPIGMGILFGLVGLLLTTIGIARGEVPPQPLNVAVALVLGGGVWFLVAWAVATAARDVEVEVAGDDGAVEAAPAAQAGGTAGES